MFCALIISSITARTKRHHLVTESAAAAYTPNLGATAIQQGIKSCVPTVTLKKKYCESAENARKESYASRKY